MIESIESIELKPCPFCGSEVVGILFDGAHIRCRGCKIIVTVSTTSHSDEDDWEQQIEEVWNRRVNE